MCFHRIVMPWLAFCAAAVDAILRLLEGLRRDELVWLNTYLTGRLRALPPPTTAAAPVQIPSTPPRTNAASDPGGELPAAALAERVGDFNMSMDPWERTGAAPQGWASHLHQTVLPVQGYIQLRPQDTTLPSFGGCSAVPAGTGSGTADAGTAAPGRVGKASPSVSIFARAPLCPNTCRHCRCKPCDIATDHDDHICYNCEQRQLFPERIPKWEILDLPICDSWCQECATQRCCTRGAHEYHLCMRCPCPRWGRGPLGCQRLIGIDLEVRTMCTNYGLKVQ